MMITQILSLALSSQTNVTAPFILTQEDAVEIDKLIDFKKCPINRSHHSRWYWFDGLAKGDKYIIDVAVVRFAILSDDKGEVVATASPEFMLDDATMIAVGTYQIPENKTEIYCPR